MTGGTGRLRRGRLEGPGGKGGTRQIARHDTQAEQVVEGPVVGDRGEDGADEPAHQARHQRTRVKMEDPEISGLHESRRGRRHGQPVLSGRRAVGVVRPRGTPQPRQFLAGRLGVV